MITFLIFVKYIYHITVTSEIAKASLRIFRIRLYLGGFNCQTLLVAKVTDFLSVVYLREIKTHVSEIIPTPSLYFDTFLRKGLTV